MLQEKSLHAALKLWYAQAGDRFEVPVDGYVIDIVRDPLLIEIQTRNFSALRQKFARLLENHQLRLVHPIPFEKWIVRVSGDGRPLGRRKSPKVGAFANIFHELVSLPELLAHPNFSLELLLIREEELRCVDLLSATKKRRRWNRGWQPYDRKLIQVVERRLITSPSELRDFIPLRLAQPFTNQDLAAALNAPYPLAQKMTYCLCRMSVVRLAGKRARSLLYTIV